VGLSRINHEWNLIHSQYLHSEPSTANELDSIHDLFEIIPHTIGLVTGSIDVSREKAQATSKEQPEQAGQRDQKEGDAVAHKPREVSQAVAL
jgi:hypothetical protein